MSEINKSNFQNRYSITKPLSALSHIPTINFNKINDFYSFSGDKSYDTILHHLYKS